MPTSRECVQYFPTKTTVEHSRRLCSDPLQPILVKNTGPLPVPNIELAVGYSTNPVLYKSNDQWEDISRATLVFDIATIW